MPQHLSDHTQQFQAFVSAFSIDTFFSSWLEVGTIQAWFNASMIPSSSAVQLTTSSVDEILPGISDYYGAGLPVDIYFKVLSVGDIGITEADQVMNGEGSIETQWWVEQANGVKVMAAQVTLTNTKFGFTALVDNMNVSLNVDQIKSTDVTVDSCTWGTLSALAIKLKLNTFFLTFKVFINKWLATLDIVIPSNIGGLFLLSDLTIEYFNDYIYAGATPTFIGTNANAAALHAALMQ